MIDGSIRIRLACKNVRILKQSVKKNLSPIIAPLTLAGFSPLSSGLKPTSKSRPSGAART